MRDCRGKISEFCYKSVKICFKILIFDLKYLFLQKNYENKVFKI